MIDMSKNKKTYEEVERDRTVLIDYLEAAEKDKARLISKYEGIISDLELKVEELEAPLFTKMDAAEAERMMISNTQQPVSEAYRENPFWDLKPEVITLEEEEFDAFVDAIGDLDYEAELIHLMKAAVAKDKAAGVLLEALRHLGWNKLADAYVEKTC